jgi:hypothetical protein
LGCIFFFWEVIRREENALAGVRGASPAPSGEGFVLETSDNTGTRRVTFVPGIGITHVSSQSLFPRGDPNHWESDARLIEVHLNRGTPAVTR